MFHWICPECGREIAPTVRECPVCDPSVDHAELVHAGVVEAPAGTANSAHVSKDDVPASPASAAAPPSPSPLRGVPPAAPSATSGKTVTKSVPRPLATRAELPAWVKNRSSNGHAADHASDATTPSEQTSAQPPAREAAPSVAPEVAPIEVKSPAPPHANQPDAPGSQPAAPTAPVAAAHKTPALELVSSSTRAHWARTLLLRRSGATAVPPVTEPEPSSSHAVPAESSNNPAINTTANSSNSPAEAPVSVPPAAAEEVVPAPVASAPSPLQVSAAPPAALPSLDAAEPEHILPSLDGSYARNALHALDAAMDLVLDDPLESSPTAALAGESVAAARPEATADQARSTKAPEEAVPEALAKTQEIVKHSAPVSETSTPTDSETEPPANPAPAVAARDTAPQTEAVAEAAKPEEARPEVAKSEVAKSEETKAVETKAVEAKSVGGDQAPTKAAPLPPAPPQEASTAPEEKAAEAKPKQQPEPPDPPVHGKVPIGVPPSPQSDRPFKMVLRPQVEAARRTPAVMDAPADRKEPAMPPVQPRIAIPVPAAQLPVPMAAQSAVPVPSTGIRVRGPQTPRPFPAPPMAPLGVYSPLANNPLRPAVPRPTVLKGDGKHRITLPGPMLTPKLVKFSDRELSAIFPEARRFKKRSIPMWMMAGLVGAVVMVAGFSGIFSFVPRSSADTRAENTSVPVSRNSGTNPLSRMVEVTGFRVLVDTTKSEIQYLVVNHSSARFADATVFVTLYGADSKAGQPPLCRFSFAAPDLGPYQSREMSSVIEKLNRPVSVPDWQDLRAYVEIGQ